MESSLLKLSYKSSYLVVGVSILLSACNVTQPEPYQADREPEERTQYSGLKGLAQHQKDQTYLMAKELKDQCDKARVDLAIAVSENNDEQAKAHQQIIDKTCV